VDPSPERHPRFLFRPEPVPLYDRGMQDIPEDHLSAAIAFALSRVPVSKDRLEAERLRNEMADAVVAQFRRCGWKVMHEPIPDHSVRLGLDPW
jgi:hypothetical protein